MSPRVEVEKSVLVVGADQEASWAVNRLLDLGYRVAWVTEGQFAETDACPSPLLTLFANSELLALEGQVGGLTAVLRQNAITCSVTASCVVVATGNERYYPAERYGLKLVSPLWTVSQVEKQLDAPRVTGQALLHRTKPIVLLLDWGGDSAMETSTQALELAIRLRHEWHAEVWVLYQDLKVDTHDLERITRDMRECGVVFCRYANLQIQPSENGVALTYEEGTITGEMLVLPEAVRPRADTASLAARLGVTVGADGYFQDINIHQYRPGISVRRGVFFAGRCHLDADLTGLRADAAQAVANVESLIGSGFCEAEATIAHVDSSKCIRCLTCIRSCPHAAVEIADYDDVTAAKILDLACKGCGACVANCPVQAIELVGQALPAWALTQ